MPGKNPALSFLAFRCSTVAYIRRLVMRAVNAGVDAGGKATDVE
jgi:hypothetical protein